MTPVTSRVTIKVDGEIILNRSGFTFRKGGVQRETVNGDSGPHGYTEQIMGARLAGNVTASEKSRLDKHDVADATILVEMNTGESYVMRNAWSTELPELNVGEGQFGVAFESGPAEEM